MVVGIDLRSIKIFQAVAVLFINYLSIYTLKKKKKETEAEGERMLCSSGSCFGLVSVEFAHTTLGV